MYSPDTRRKAGGAALVELMIGITMGLMVVLAALSAASMTLTVWAASRDASDLQERADSALRQIGAQVRKAGSVQMQPWGAGARFSDAFPGWGDTGRAVTGIEGGPGKSDVLRVSSEPGDGERDCLGNEPDNIHRLDSEFLLVADPTANRRLALYCDGAAASTARQSLVAGVDDFQVLYGIRDAAEGLRYVTADALPAAAEVLAVTVCLQLSSTTSHGAPAYLDCNAKPIPASKTAGRMVRIARGVFMVRNAAG